MPRVKIFIDFWNFQLGLSHAEKAPFPPDWRALPAVILQEVNALLAPETCTNDGVYVFGSFDDANPNDKKLLNWANGILGTFPDYHITFVPRRKRESGSICPTCHLEVTECPVCENSMLGTQEKGVDVNIAVEMIRHAWEGAYEVAVLVSSDSDLAPAVELLQSKGLIVIHGKLPPSGYELTTVSQGNIDLTAIRHRYRR